MENGTEDVLGWSYEKEVENVESHNAEGWAYVEWKKGGAEICRVKTVHLAGVWSIRVGDDEAYPDYRGATSWNRIKMLPEDQALALLKRYKRLRPAGSFPMPTGEIPEGD